MLGAIQLYYNAGSPRSFMQVISGALLFWGYVSDYMGRPLSFALTVWSNTTAVESE